MGIHGSFRNLVFTKIHVMLVIPLILAGCRPSDGIKLGKVEGTVTVDGQPIEGAELTFQPDAARPSYGITDSAGHYFLQFTMDRDGAVVGKHTVSITTKRSQSGGEGGAPLIAARKEVLPAKYHTATELTRDVIAGANRIDFELLTSK